MYEVYFSVSIDGRFLFRTDVTTDSVSIAITAAHLIDKFSEKEGYAVERMSRKAAWSSEVVQLNGGIPVMRKR